MEFKGDEPAAEGFGDAMAEHLMRTFNDDESIIDIDTNIKPEEVEDEDDSGTDKN